MEILNVENLSFGYNQIKILNNLTFKLKHKEILVILGESGSGKSTLLNILSGLETKFTGKVYSNLTDLRIGYVFQDYALFPHMTVYENILYPLRVKHSLFAKSYKTISEKYKKDVFDSAKIVNLEESLLTRYPESLSGGQKQRVSIARALINKPELIFMDEPFSSLDQSLKIELRAELKNIKKNVDTTIVYVTHDENDALELADRILILKDSKIEQIGTVENIIYQPKSLYVLKYLGYPKANILGVRDFPNMLKINDDIQWICFRPSDVSEFLVEDSICFEGEFIECVFNGSSFIKKVKYNNIIINLISNNCNPVTHIYIKYSNLLYFNKDENRI